jgi:hypothetical protein
MIARLHSFVVLHGATGYRYNNKDKPFHFGFLPDIRFRSSMAFNISACFVDVASAILFIVFNISTCVFSTAVIFVSRIPLSRASELHCIKTVQIMLKIARAVAAIKPVNDFLEKKDNLHTVKGY